jgi:hypothetical protein
MRTRVVLLLASLFLAGCPHQSPGARMQETASDLNLNARFGRMELAAESVSPKAKEQFFEHRKGWGGKIRIADFELAGVRLAKNEEDADVFVKVAWFNVNEGDLHTTTLAQKWHDFRGDWKLTSEERLDGDLGLLGEPAPPPTGAPPSPKPSQFPTIRLGRVGPVDEELPPGTAP